MRNDFPLRVALLSRINFTSLHSLRFARIWFVSYLDDNTRYSNSKLSLFVRVSLNSLGSFGTLTLPLRVALLSRINLRHFILYGSEVHIFKNFFPTPFPITKSLVSLPSLAEQSDVHYTASTTFLPSVVDGASKARRRLLVSLAYARFLLFASQKCASDYVLPYLKCCYSLT